MLNRPSPESTKENPLLESPYYQTSALGMSNIPVGTGWLLLTGENFATLLGDDFAFLGP